MTRHSYRDRSRTRAIKPLARSIRPFPPPPPRRAPRGGTASRYSRARRSCARRTFCRSARARRPIPRSNRASRRAPRRAARDARGTTRVFYRAFRRRGPRRRHPPKTPTPRRRRPRLFPTAASSAPTRPRARTETRTTNARRRRLRPYRRAWRVRGRSCAARRFVGAPHARPRPARRARAETSEQSVSPRRVRRRALFFFFFSHPRRSPPRRARTRPTKPRSTLSGERLLSFSFSVLPHRRRNRTSAFATRLRRTRGTSPKASQTSGAARKRPRAPRR
mmetsp:Transcript_551/g.2143  ORF Transcript_551/g.2143 Transcript_551/m.2143 type:complete len:278 (-) Transcript_551:155-988(-)